MNYLKILFYYIKNPDIFLHVAAKFFDEMHGAYIYDNLEEANIINEHENLHMYKNITIKK